MQEIKSLGKCLYCEKKFSKAGINRHLHKHLEGKIVGNKPGKSFLLKIIPDASYYGKSPYFLSIWIDGETEMDELDEFLRAIWLECCGHLSAFIDPKKRRQSGGIWGFFEAQELLEKGKMEEYEKLMEDSNGEIPMSRKCKDVFHKAMKLEYEYDFGSSTRLSVTLLHEYPNAAEEPLVLLSRNEPLGLLCETCKKEPAVIMCSVCGYDDEDTIFCAKCAKKHTKNCEDFDDYAAMPIINSPRMGVCGYEGGSIDQKRDGVLSIT